MDRYRDELKNNAAYIGTPGKGILVVDESTGTIGKHLASISVENVESNRRAVREILFCTPGALQYLNGVILCEETLYQKTADGKPFVDVLKEGGVLPGIKVDQGTFELADTNGETNTQGIDGLFERCQKYYEAGARFAKWRAVFKISPKEPSELAIKANAHSLALYAITCHEGGLVPIMETKILADGSHDINKCAEVTKRVLTACYEALTDRHVLLEGTVLKPNLVTPGSKGPVVANEVIAECTGQVLQPIVPREVPTVVLPFRVWSEGKALEAMKKLQPRMPWTVAFSFGLALQESTLKALTEKEEIVKKAQAAFLAKCKASSEATICLYKGEDTQLREGALQDVRLELTPSDRTEALPKHKLKRRRM